MESAVGYEKELNAHVQKERAALVLASKTGELLYDKGIELVLYRNHLLDRTGSEILNLHDYSKNVGLIAQEVQNILPEIVKPAPFDIDENNKSKTGKNYLTVQYEKLIPLIVETIKIQQVEIEQLRKRLTDGN